MTAVVVVAMAAATLMTTAPNDANAMGPTIVLDLDGVYLDGPLTPLPDPNLLPTMNTFIWNNGFVPTTEPFSAAGYPWPADYNNAGLVVPAVPQAVDWVLIELRDQNAIDDVVAAYAAFLTVDGRVVNADGDPVSMDVKKAGKHFLAVQHRNHLGYATATPIILNAGNAGNTHTMGQAPTQGPGQAGIHGQPDQHVSYTAGGETIYAMVAGDANFDGVINAADRSKIFNDRTLFGYQMSDVDLDVNVGVPDQDIAWDNANIVQPYDI